MTHAELPAADLFALLDEVVGRATTSTDDSFKAAERSYEIRRRGLVDQLAELDRQHAEQIAASQERTRGYFDELRKLVVGNREQLFPATSREKRLSRVTLRLRTHYFVQPDSKHHDAHMRLVTRANAPAGITPRGREALMAQVSHAAGIGHYEQLVVSFNDGGQDDVVISLRD